MGDGIGFAEALLGMPGFKITAVDELEHGELVVDVETTATVAWCRSCGVRAEAQDRMATELRDLACFGRPVRLVWSKRRWRCPIGECPARTWTETHEQVTPRLSITERAGVEACRLVGEHARSVASVAKEFGVTWATIMSSVRRHGQPLIDDPERVGTVTALGIDETSFLKANAQHHTKLVTGFVSLDRHIMIDLVQGNTAADVRAWLGAQPAEWLGRISVVATDLHEGFRNGLSPHLDHAVKVADAFHVVQVANRCLDQTRRRVQNETLGHRGRKDDPLYRIRRIMLTGAERLDEHGTSRFLLGMRAGDPKDEVLGAWLAKESVRDVYLASNRADAQALLDKTIIGASCDNVPEIRALGATLKRWRPEILARFDTGASNGPTEGLNLLVKKVKRCGHGFRSFDNYRIRVLLHTGGIKWQTPRATPIRTRSPHPIA